MRGCKGGKGSFKGASPYSIGSDVYRRAPGCVLALAPARFSPVTGNSSGSVQTLLQTSLRRSAVKSRLRALSVTCVIGYVRHGIRRTSCYNACYNMTYVITPLFLILTICHIPKTRKYKETSVRAKSQRSGAQLLYSYRYVTHWRSGQCRHHMLQKTSDTTLGET